MAFDFNADEVFEMAEQIETNGAAFYRQAAENIPEEDIRRLFLDLAAMEDEHKKTFAALRARLNKDERSSTVFDPEGESARYLKALADLRVFDRTAEEPFRLDDNLTGSEKLRKVFWGAISREKESIVFYTGLRELVSKKLGRDRINDIIREEMKHLRILSHELGKLL
jgi:rubrerythrin